MTAPLSDLHGMSPAHGGLPHESLVLEPGLVIAKKYALDRPAGFGGMAQLWVATNQATGAEICVKLLVPDPETGGHTTESVERFRREALAAARLSHRAIVRVFDLLELDAKGGVVAKGELPHAYAIVMELLHGETLGDMLAKRGKIPMEEAIDLFLPIISALGHAHRASVIHRDLKPDNIFMANDPDGQVIPKVLDFGVSKIERADALTSEGVALGTPCFMSPEQARGSLKIDARSDVFSAGILFYMMLTGRNPFEDAPTFAATVDAVLRRQISQPAEITDPIWAVIAKSIEKEPAQRWNDATEMGIALRKASGRRATTESLASIDIAAAPSSMTPAEPLPARTSEPGAGPALVPAPDATIEDLGLGADAAAKRRRTIVFGVIGVCAFIVLVAGLVSALDSKPKADPHNEPTKPVQSAKSAQAPADVPTPASPSPSTATTATPSETPTSTAQVAPTRSAAAPARPSTNRPPKKPGGNIARDPGF